MMKTLFTQLALLFILGVCMLSSSCEKDKEILGCTDIASVNYNADATTDDGSCFYAREKFIGTYNATELCPSGDYSWVMSISEEEGDIKLVSMQNLGDFDQTFPAEIDGDNITFDYDDDIISIDGSGVLAADGITLTITYHVVVPSFNFEESCEVTAIKQ